MQVDDRKAEESFPRDWEFYTKCVCW